MTEDQIETAVARKFDRLDARLMAHRIDQAEYDAEAQRIDAWATMKLTTRDHAAEDF